MHASRWSHFLDALKSQGSEVRGGPFTQTSLVPTIRDSKQLHDHAIRCYGHDQASEGQLKYIVELSKLPAAVTLLLYHNRPQTVLSIGGHATFLRNSQAVDIVGKSSCLWVPIDRFALTLLHHVQAVDVVRQSSRLWVAVDGIRPPGLVLISGLGHMKSIRRTHYWCTGRGGRQQGSASGDDLETHRMFLVKGRVGDS